MENLVIIVYRYFHNLNVNYDNVCILTLKIRNYYVKLMLQMTSQKVYLFVIWKLLLLNQSPKISLNYLLNFGFSFVINTITSLIKFNIWIFKFILF